MKRSGLYLLWANQGGLSLITAIFLLLLFAVLAALMSTVISTAHTTSAEDVLGTRAYQSARGGIEWGLYQVLDPDNTAASNAASAPNALVACFCPTVSLPNCPALNTASVTGLGATVTVTCAAYPSTAPNYYREGSKYLRIYRITSTATLQGPAGIVVERRLEVTAEKCRDGAAAKPYDC